MTTIHKYPIKRQECEYGCYEIEVPSGAVPVSVGVQNGALCVWAEVEPKAEPYEMTIAIVGTGKPKPEGGFWTFIGTVFQGPFVWHVYHDN